MTHITKPSLSLLDVVDRLNLFHSIIPLCPSHYQFFASIPAHIPYLSGFEFHLSALGQSCDSLVCFLTRNLPGFARYFVANYDKSTHLSQARSAAQLLLQLPNLLCLTDHVWLELDALPSDSLSLCCNHSNKQSQAERTSLLTESQVLTSQWISTLSANPVPLFNFNRRLAEIFTIVPDWFIAEIGIMDRDSSKAHIKLLLNPPKSYSFAEFLDYYILLSPNSLPSILQLKASLLARVLDSYPCHCQLSIALYQDQIICAIEVLPVFDNFAIRQYDELFSSILRCSSDLLGCPDLNAKLDSQTLFVDIDGLRFSSRMHHLKITQYT